MFQINSSGITIARDDIFPFIGGGNKGRKIAAIANDILNSNYNAVVTTGGIQSNHCRATAIFCAQYRLACTLVLHGSKERFLVESGNAKIMRQSGAEILFVENSSEIGPTMDYIMESYQKEGKNPYYLNGGGHNMLGGKAYIEVVADLKDFCENKQWFPSHIFLASGTGSTQAGLLAGLDKYGLKSKVIGISVARKQQYAETLIRDFYNRLCENYDIYSTNQAVTVLDDYLFGGYEGYNDDILKLSQQSLQLYGVLLDTCYTAKAFYGMLKYMEKNKIDSKDVLFWHTGGIFNFLAT
jgi:D-cysteine desulfhydrase